MARLDFNFAAWVAQDRPATLAAAIEGYYNQAKVDRMVQEQEQEHHETTNTEHWSWPVGTA